MHTINGRKPLYARAHNRPRAGQSLLKSLSAFLLLLFLPLTVSADLTTGLVGHYTFDGNAKDVSGNGRHGTVNGATLGVDRHGGAGKSYSFDGVNDTIVISANNWPGGNSDRTVSIWFKTSSTSQSSLFTFGDGKRSCIVN